MASPNTGLGALFAGAGTARVISTRVGRLLRPGTSALYTCPSSHSRKSRSCLFSATGSDAARRGVATPARVGRRSRRRRRPGRRRSARRRARLGSPPGPAGCDLRRGGRDHARPGARLGRRAPARSRPRVRRDVTAGDHPATAPTDTGPAAAPSVGAPGPTGTTTDGSVADHAAPARAAQDPDRGGRRSRRPLGQLVAGPHRLRCGRADRPATRNPRSSPLGGQSFTGGPASRLAPHITSVRGDPPCPHSKPPTRSR